MSCLLPGNCLNQQLVVPWQYEWGGGGGFKGGSPVVKWEVPISVTADEVKVRRRRKP